MRPKEYYEIKPVQEESNFVFMLLPSELEEQYKEHIKKPIEAIETDHGNFQCESYLDFPVGSQVMEEVWRGIGRASIVIADITYFKPNVMYELGVALMTKDHVYIIANDVNQKNAQVALPYDLVQTKVDFYSDNNLTAMTENIVAYIRKRRPSVYSTSPTFKNAQAAAYVQSAQERVEANDFNTALVLLDAADKLESDHWFIHQAWGNVLTKTKDYKAANEKFMKAIDSTESDRQKSLIYIDLAKMRRLNNDANGAISAYDKAENLDRTNPDLYDHWAYLYYTMGNFQEASNKMLSAVRLLDNKENQLKAKYYYQRLIDKQFTLPLGKWLKKMKQEEERKLIEQNKKKRINSRPNTGLGYQDKQIAFRNFEKKYGVGKVVTGEVTNTRADLGVFVQFETGITGLIFRGKLAPNFDAESRFEIGKKIEVVVQRYKYNKLQIELDLA